MKTNISFLLPTVFLGILMVSCAKESKLDIVSDTLSIVKTYQPNAAYGKDAVIESILPGLNFGDSIPFTIFAWTNSGIFNTARALLEFDLSDIPPQTILKEAKLSLYWISYGNLNEQTGYNSFSIYRITDEWVENTVTWNNRPAISDENVVTIAKSISAHQSYIDIDVKALVQDMINNPSESHGFMLMLNEEAPYRLVILASSDYSESNKRPKLTISF